MRRYGEEVPDTYELLDSARRELDDAYTQLRSGQGGPLGGPRKRGVRWGYVAAGAVAAAVVGFLAGVTVGSANEPPAVSRPQVTAPGEPTETPAQVDPSPADEPRGPVGSFTRADGDSDSPHDEGTLRNPLPTGVAVSNGEWEVTLGEPREAWGEIRAENSLNDPPPAGMEFWIVPVTATSIGDGPARMGDLTIQFEGRDKETYAGMCGVVPDTIALVGELYQGGTGEGQDCLEVPAGADGLWTLRSGWDAEPVYFDAGH